MKPGFGALLLAAMLFAAPSPLRAQAPGAPHSKRACVGAAGIRYPYPRGATAGLSSAKQEFRYLDRYI